MFKMCKTINNRKMPPSFGHRGLELPASISESSGESEDDTAWKIDTALKIMQCRKNEKINERYDQKRDSF